MKHLGFLIAMLCAQLVAPVMAAEPPPAASPAPATAAVPTASPPVAKPTPNSPAPAAATATAAATPPLTEEEQKAADAAEAKKMRGLGWRPEVQSGHTVYCRKEAEIGSRFPTKDCRTAAAIEEQTRRSQESINSSPANALIGTGNSR
jgi:hypothetical protein